MDTRVHIVVLSLPADADRATGTHLPWLTPAERARLDAMTAPRRRLQFIAGHRLARELAARTTRSTFADWSLDADTDGAPRLVAGNAALPALHVSLAHGGDRVACAVGATPLGIDLECAPRPRDLVALARHALSSCNACEVAAVDGDERVAAFYRYWTLAEAQGKHGGRGFHAQASRGRTFRECVDASARGLTWQAGELTLALWSEAIAPEAVVIEGWDAPAPRYWAAESAGPATTGD